MQECQCGETTHKDLCLKPLKCKKSRSEKTAKVSEEEAMSSALVSALTHTPVGGGGGSDYSPPIILQLFLLALADAARNEPICHRGGGGGEES